MPTNPDPARRLRRNSVAALATFATLTGSLAAQPANSAKPPVPGPPLSEETVMLSPFQVASDTDRGYQALNTLSGTRLNSKLEDLGASISVITKQQMQDTAVLDLNDVFLYEANTEGTGNYTQFTPNRNGGVIDGTANDPATANRIRGVGSPISGSGVNVSLGNFSSNARIPMDTYNIDSVEISRGPNSNLFGLGAAAGTVNLVQSKANLTRHVAGVTARVDSEGGHRASLDVSRYLLKDKLAFRFSTVTEEKGFTRKPAEEKIKRYFGAVQARPFANTTVNASFERYDNSYRRPNSLTPRDTTYEWQAGGRPTFDPTTQRVTFANGTHLRSLSVCQRKHHASRRPDGRGLQSHDCRRRKYRRIVLHSGPRRQRHHHRHPFALHSEQQRPLHPDRHRYSPPQGQPLPAVLRSRHHRQVPLRLVLINYTAANHGEDTAQTLRLEGEQILLNRGSHLLATRAGHMVPPRLRPRKQRLHR
jgi:outer membrane receptor protein involved in Fe transport